ncbi:sensor domain-containing diguanylate cyclase [Pleurocapsa sp. FMAR1]|uniref:sensor domain-containing diguanylate cyclase n=1 Tax=Pleurocapsa sp. FMAR1 TaxID=3040204 RepID=UPI0029C6D720|nr:diguanylate cyclase [Pleurocapsa sp. FMAR1]
MIVPQVLSALQYTSHGHYYLWQTPFIWLHVAAEALIAIAFYSISLALIYFVRNRKDLPYKSIFILFSAFILFCGTTHILSIWTLWHPDYWLSAIVKGFTALISLYTALSSIPLIPQALNLPSTQELASCNLKLQDEISSKEAAQQEICQLNQELEQRVAEKTAALVKVNQDLQESILFKEKIVNSTPNILYIYDLESNRNVFGNSFISELLGYSPLELNKFQSRLLDELIHPEDLEGLKQHFQNCLLLESDNCLEIEYRLKDNRGQWYWLHDKNTIFARNADGKPKQILGIARDITKSKEIRDRAETLNQKLEEKVLALEKNNQARIKLAQMNEFIQACAGLVEAEEVLADLLQPLFPDSHGAIYLVNNSENLLKAIAAWGMANSYSSFELKECWALRRGDSHLVHFDTPGLYCGHIAHNTNYTQTLCLPMIAKGETLGMLYLCFDEYKTIDRTTQELAETVAQNIAMSFANLRLQEKLRYQSLRDPLTGLFNRRYLEESLAKEINRAYRKQQFISVLIMDIDHFKRFNDIHGHSAGDLVLKKVAAFLLSQVRKYDIACRYGGEELIVIMPDAAIEDAIIRAEAIRTGIKNLNLEHKGKELESISISVGVSCFPDDSINADGLICAADKALYQAKAQGRDCVQRC